jgi:hypothetical protein
MRVNSSNPKVSEDVVMDTTTAEEPEIPDVEGMLYHLSGYFSIAESWNI